MITQIPDMPEGSIGFSVSGTITSDEYHLLIEPVMAAIDQGQPINYLFATEADFGGIDMGALWQDVKAAGSIGLKHHAAWRRMAVVSDKEWIRNAVSVFGWISPGELRVFEPSRLEEAKVWVAAE
jgi:stage II sporulation SpoAA-like protein